MPARVGGTGSISLPGETHEGIEEGRKGGGLGVTGANTALSLQSRSFLVPFFSHGEG